MGFPFENQRWLAGKSGFNEHFTGENQLQVGDCRSVSMNSGGKTRSLTVEENNHPGMDIYI